MYMIPFFIGYTASYIIIQEFCMLKLMDVPEKRRQCAAFTAAYTFVFMGAEFALTIYYRDDATPFTDLAVSLVHAVFTFVLLATVAVYARGYLPRNFIKLFLYYDVLSVLGAIVITKRLPSLVAGEGSSFEEGTSMAEVRSLADWPVLADFAGMVIITLVTGLLINRKLTKALEKIPDRICLMVLLIAFVSYILRIAVETAGAGRSLRNIENLSFSLFCCFIFLAILFAVLAAVFFQNARLRRTYQRLVELEAGIQYEYYESIRAINEDVRRLRHDLSNHLTVMKAARGCDREGTKGEGYEKELLHICDEIEGLLEEKTRWEKLPVRGLSNREKYEIYKYILKTAGDYGISPESLKTERPPTAGGGIDVVFPRGKGRRMRPFLLKRNIMYKLVETAVSLRGGSAEWLKGEEKCIFRILF